MSKVLGKDVLLLFFIDGQWVPYACAVSCSLETTTEFVETSFLNSGPWKSFEPTYNSFSGELSGLVSLGGSDVINLPDLRSRQLAHEKLRLRFEREDGDGNIYTDECYAYLSNIRDEGSIDGMNSFSASLRGTESITQIFTPTNTTGGKVQRDQFTLPASGTSITRTALIGMDLLEVVRDGIGNSKIITTGSPANKEVLFDSTTGTLTWFIPFAEDGTEEYYALYQTP